MKRLRQIKASAGSGKTYALTQNFLGALEHCGKEGIPHAAPGCALNPEKLPETFGNVLAITFTNAAVAEMRARVIKKLKLCALGVDKDIAPQKAAEWLENILADMDNLNIRTIDSLLQAIVRSASLDLNLHPDFEPVFESRDALLPLMDLYLTKALEKDDEAHKRLRQAFITIVELEQTKNFVAGSSFLGKIFQFVDGALKNEYDGLTHSGELDKKYREICDNLSDTARKFLAAIKKHPENELPNHAETYLKALAKNDYSGIERAYLNHTHINKFLKTSSIITQEIQDAFDTFVQAKDDARRLYKNLKNARKYAPLIEIARDLAVAYRATMNMEGACPSALLPVLAKEALESEHGVADALCRLGNRLTHFLIDEFQDTSREQWEAIRPLVQNALAGKGSITWVGDIKQSVYGWRNADPALFNGIIGDLISESSAENAQFEDLPCNWRSLPEIIYFNNKLFASLGDEAFDRALLADSIKDIAGSPALEKAIERLTASFGNTVQKLSPSTPDHGGYVALTPVPQGTNADPSEELLKELTKTVNKIRERRPSSDILVLCRSKAQATLAAETLISADIPVITENSLTLSSHPIVRQIIAFLQYLYEPEDDVAFWTLACGSIMREYPQAGLPGAEELAEWAAKPRNVCLAKKFRKDYFSAWHKLFYPFERQAGLFTPYDTIREWLKFFHVEERYPEAGTFIRSLLEVAHRAEIKGYASIESFLSWWKEKGIEEKAPMPEKMDAVSIMTIHKSKGLEAPVVIVPWTKYTLAYNDFIPAVFEHDGMRMVELVRKHHGDLYFKHISDKLAENLDMLYVAFTRAKEELYVFTPEVKNKKKAPLLNKLLEKAGIAVPCEFGIPPEAPESRTCENIKNEILQTKASPTPAAQRIYERDWNLMDWQAPLNVFRDPLNFDMFRGEARGTFLHYCLEHLAVADTPEKSARNAFEFGLANSDIIVPDDPELRNELMADLVWFASLPQCEHWLKNGRREQSIMDKNGKLMRIDNLVEDDRTLLILDYKSGEISPEHVEQMKEYISCLKDCQNPGCEIRAVLIYLDKKLFRLVDENGAHEPVEYFPL